MNKLSKEIKTELDKLHDLDYERGSWGAAVSTPYRVKKWLSKELSDRLLAAALAEWDKAKAVFDSIPASKRMTSYHSLCAELSAWEFHGAPLPVKVEGRTVYAAFTDYEQRKNGRRVAYICERDPVCFRFFMNGNTTGYPSYSTAMRYMVYWDYKAQRFYAYEWLRASTQPIPDEKLRRNWARKSKEREFMNECKKLQTKLLKAGIEIKSLVKDGGRWHDDVYVDCYDAREIPDCEKAVPA